MDTLQAIEKRWGCRKYSDEPIDKEKLGLILNAARFAPSAGNLQDRSFIVVKKQETREAIAKACGNQNWMQTAPIHVVIVSENQKLSKFFGIKGEKIYSVQDTAFAAENMLLAATELGVGCSLVVGFNEELLNEILKIKSPAQVLAVIALGKAAEEAKQASKYPLERFVYFEQYGEKVENVALALEEWSTVRKQITEPIIKETKKQTKNIFEKIKSAFKKKEETPTEDHFMEQQESKKPEEARSTHKETGTESKEAEEIPRHLPKRNQF